MAQPVALSTTKRKFHKLLDNLTTSKSTPNLASTLRTANASSCSLATPEPPPKRSRLSDLSTRMSLDGSTPRTIRSVKSKVADTTPRKTPNYAPYSQPAFLGRLKSFSDVKLWTSKPDAISEVEWAKRGWVCVGWNTVACKGGCAARVVVALRPKRKNEAGKEIEGTEEWGGEVEEELVGRYEGLLVEGHHEGCLWRKAGCKKDIFHLPIANREVSETELRDRYTSLIAIEAHLPPLESITYPGVAPETLLSAFPLSLFSITDDPTTTTPAPSTEPPQPSLTAFTFALYGWSGISQDGLHLATCNHCFQRVGLWLYSTERLATMSAKIGAEESQLRLNLLETHREHCPWKNAEAQNNPPDGQVAGFAAWRTLQFMLEARRRRNTIASAGSGDERGGRTEDGEKGEGIAERWQRLKSKLKRTTSKRSLKSLGRGKD